MSIEIINLTPYKEQPVPEVGKEYHIFDDGKVRLSRHSICKICKVVPFNECNDLELLEAWHDEVLRAYWLFSPETDYFVNGAVKKEDGVFEIHHFVRTLDGGWFSIDYPKSWTASRLDIDGSLFKILEEQYNVK
jgi:hypothetical protein